jgi:hydroxyethylthiazole kinase-like uncharacterized protein yjeF
MLELLTSEEMSEADRLTIPGGTSGLALMEAAGLAVADAACVRLGGRRVVVIAGPGNNGGDGFVAARIVAERGHKVRLLLVGDRAKMKGDAAQAAARWTGPVEAASPDLVDPDALVIDALFGAGLDREVTGAPRAMIEAMNRAPSPVIAVDLPSGINGTTGAVMGAAVKADHTVTFFRRKPGHLLLPGRMHCGTVEVADIGIPAGVLGRVQPRTFANESPLWSAHFPVPQPDAHKYARGHAVVVSGGGASTTGAARLAARGALRAGAGLVTIASPREALAVNAASSLAIMVRPVDGEGELRAFLEDTRHNAVVLGPGGGTGEPMRRQVLAALESEAAVVLDADALTGFAECPDVLFEAIRARSGKPVVLTPHAGEFARLFSNIVGNPQLHSKLEQARAAAALSGAVVLLKGADSVVAAPDGRASIAANAPAYLATAGAGDVLAGIAAGLLAQHMPIFEAASAAVWVHGEAARAFGPGLIAEDLPEALPAVYRRLFSLPGRH